MLLFTEKKVEEEEEPPAKLLDDLFRKTKATPCIYWLPLTEEQVSLYFVYSDCLFRIYIAYIYMDTTKLFSNIYSWRKQGPRSVTS